MLGYVLKFFKVCVIVERVKACPTGYLTLYIKYNKFKTNSEKKKKKKLSLIIVINFFFDITVDFLKI